VSGARGSKHCGFLMPPLQTDTQVELAAQNIRDRAAALSRPFAFETGVNYFLPRDCEIPPVLRNRNDRLLRDANRQEVHDRSAWPDSWMRPFWYRM
jgi:hypothetical protein